MAILKDPAITIRVDSTEVDTAIAKAKALKELLTECQALALSIAGAGVRVDIDGEEDSQ